MCQFELIRRKMLAVFVLCVEFTFSDCYLMRLQVTKLEKCFEHRREMYDVICSECCGGVYKHRFVLFLGLTVSESVLKMFNRRSHTECGPVS